jgi:hypothetical protein
MNADKRRSEIPPFSERTCAPVVVKGTSKMNCLNNVLEESNQL